MKNIIFILIGLMSLNVVAQDVTIDAFLEKWANSKTYLLEIAEAMPENNYDFKPTEREMDFRSQLIHIRGNMLWLGNTYFLDQDNKKESLDLGSKSKTEIMETLFASFDAISEMVKLIKSEDLAEKVDFFAGQKNKLQILNLMQDHVTHHRGQLVVYLNLNNIEPPKYVGW